MGAEAQLQTSIIGYARNRGAYVVKIHQTGRGIRGIPDLLMCYRGYFIAVEVKAPGAKTLKAREQAQAEQLHAVKAAGGVAFRATDYEAVLDVFEQIDRLINVMASSAPMGKRVIAPHVARPHIVDLDTAA